MNLLNSIGALEALGLWLPKSGTKPNHRYLNYLNKRNLLPRLVLGHRTYRYDLKDCEALLHRCKTEGISLTVKA